MTCECVRQNYQGGYSGEKPGLESLWASARGFGVMAFRAHEAVRSWGEAEARAAGGAGFLGGKDWKGQRPMGSGLPVESCMARGEPWAGPRMDCVGLPPIPFHLRLRLHFL